MFKHIKVERATVTAEVPQGTPDEQRAAERIITLNDLRLLVETTKDWDGRTGVSVGTGSIEVSR